MDIFKEYSELKKDIEFKKFLRDHKDYYLVHVLVPENSNSIEFGYYNKKTDKIVVFKTNPTMKGKEEEVFKEGKTISELKLDDLKINFEDALQKTKEIFKTQYSAEVTNKKIIILQQIQEPVWNMTFVCASLNIINIRVNAITGEVVRNNKASLLNMAGMMK